MMTTQSLELKRSRTNAFAQLRKLLPELRSAIFLYSIDRRDPEILRTIARGKIIYDAVGRQLPVPPQLDRTKWETALEQIVDRFGYTAFSTTVDLA